MKLYRYAAMYALAVLASASVVSATVPSLVNYQGRLTTMSGTNVSGPTAMTFRIFNAEVGGSELWSETQPSVAVADGLFNVVLGSINPLGAGLFASPPLGGAPPFGDRYLEVEVNGEVISPRTRFISVAYAVGAERMFGDVHTNPGEVLVLGSGGDELAGMKGADTASTVTVHHTTTPGHKYIDALRVSASGAEATAIGDLDGDGAPDVVAAMRVDDSAGVVSASQEGVEASMGTRKGWDGTIKGSCALTSGANRSVISTVDDSASAVSASQGAVEVSMGTRKGWDGTIKGSCYLTSGTDRSVSATVDDSAGVVAATEGAVQVSMGTRKGWDGTIKGSCVIESGTDRSVSATVDDSAGVVAASEGTVAVSMGTRKGWDGTIKGSCVIESGTDRSVSATVDDSASVVASTQGTVEVSMGARKGWDGTIKGSCIVSSGTNRMAEMNSDGNGFLENSLGIGVDATHRIDVAGGAYCDGTDWVNASDANAKENFAPVDGADLLRKIAALEITQWNYKGDRSTEHIGPTAQDFRETFGVGSDGKSISTIDPSGIALAAIKELDRRNRELAGENAELKRRIEELARRVEQVAGQR